VFHSRIWLVASPFDTKQVRPPRHPPNRSPRKCCLHAVPTWAIAPSSYPAAAARANPFTYFIPGVVPPRTRRPPPFRPLRSASPRPTRAFATSRLNPAHRPVHERPIPPEPLQTPDRMKYSAIDHHHPRSPINRRTRACPQAQYSCPCDRAVDRPPWKNVLIASDFCRFGPHANRLPPDHEPPFCLRYPNRTFGVGWDEVPRPDLHR
jgi:hypothetical protein